MTSVRIHRLATSTFLLLLAPAAAARAADIHIPIHLEHAFLQQVLLSTVFTEPGSSVNVLREGTGCSFLQLSSPRVDSVGVRLHVLANGHARIGKKIGQSCVSAAEWKGTVDVLEEVRVDPGGPTLSFRVTDAKLHGDKPDGSTVSTLDRWIKQYFDPRLETVTVDLKPAMTELEELVPAVLPREEKEVTESIIESFRVEGAEADDTGVVTHLRLELPDRPAPAATASAPAAAGRGADDDDADGASPPAPALSADDLARWDAAWQRWDSFLTFVAKHVANDAHSRELRDALLGVLVDSRQDVLEILAPSQGGGADPLRSLFTHTWDRLAPVLRTVSATMPGTDALRYASFISAGDALAAIDAMGPQIGFDITADGLRRLAHILTPQLAEDPLAYGEEVDPELRQAFGFGRPLLNPAQPPAEDAATAAAPSEPTVKAPPTEAETIARLNRWLPGRDELDDYLPMVRELLLRSADRAADSTELTPGLRDTFRTLVLATAWQESCWRQWSSDRGGSLQAVRSRAGAVGLMQVLERVWRGFYDLRALRTDIDYNVRAGTEILARYLTENSLPAASTARASSPDMLSRTTYAIYHGGPRRGTDRVENPRTPNRFRKIDNQFWSRYQAVKAGQVARVRECFGGG